jgi:hypothetical protein
MSWGIQVVATNNADAKLKLAKAFSGPVTATASAGPLADPPAGLEDDGERETVRQVAALIDQCLATFDPAKPVLVNANGHLGRDPKGGAYQWVNLSIQPQ